MALIPDLPEANSLASTDLLVKDTGAATQKITAENAASSLLSLFPTVPITKGGTGATTANGARNNLEVKPMYSWTLNSGVAASFTVSNSSRHFVVVVGSSTIRDGMFLVRASSTGGMGVTDIHKGSSLSYSTTTNNFTITVSDGVATIMFITLTGNMVTKDE